MKIIEAERFYKADKKKYNILDNKEFLKYFNGMIKNGYHSYMDLEELQSLIDHITYWYEIKYPERELEKQDGIIHMDFEDIERISKHMDFRQLLYRLPHKELLLMESEYRSTGGGLQAKYDEKGNKIGEKTVLFMTLKNKAHDPFDFDSLSEVFITADTKTGIVEPTYFFQEKFSKDEVDLKALYSVLKDVLPEIDTTNLEQCLYDHSCDMDLRNRILELVALKLLYSPNTIPERGYERAKRFIGEVNKKLGLSLTTDEIDEIMGRDYTNGEKWELVRKTYINNRGEEEGFYTLEDTNKKEDKTVKGFVKKFINRK